MVIKYHICKLNIYEININRIKCILLYRITKYMNVNIVENKTIKNAPWVEKYRPKNFDNIVLDPINRQIFTNILEKNYFPNLLFYGPPGTGKRQP